MIRALLPALLFASGLFASGALAHAASGAQDASAAQDPGGAQDKIRFDPSRDLEGFETAAASDHPELYPIRRYKALRDT